MKPRFRCHPCTFRHFDSHRLPDPHLTHHVRLFPHRSPQRSSANAAVGGLEPPPAGRLRRAYLHLPRSTASRSSAYRQPPSAFVTHHLARLTEALSVLWVYSALAAGSWDVAFRLIRRADS